MIMVPTDDGDKGLVTRDEISARLFSAQERAAMTYAFSANTDGEDGQSGSPYNLLFRFFIPNNGEAETFVANYNNGPVTCNFDIDFALNGTSLSRTVSFHCNNMVARDSSSGTLSSRLFGSGVYLSRDLNNSIEYKPIHEISFSGTGPVDIVMSVKTSVNIYNITPGTLPDISWPDTTAITVLGSTRFRICGYIKKGYRA